MPAFVADTGLLPGVVHAGGASDVLRLLAGAVAASAFSPSTRLSGSRERAYERYEGRPSRPVAVNGKDRPVALKDARAIGAPPEAGRAGRSSTKQGGRGDQRARTREYRNAQGRLPGLGTGLHREPAGFGRNQGERWSVRSRPKHMAVPI